MTDMQLYLVVPLAPLAGAIVAGLFGRQVGRAGAHWAAILGVAISFFASCLVFYDVLGGTTFNGPVYTWLVSDAARFEIGFMIDRLSALMMVVVTFVSLMVHIYTIGYMADDPGYQRFFAYTALFTFAMLMLVMANNFLQLFFGWEAVGVVSYLLIGFWYQRQSAIYANLKAFLVNRVGDFGFLLGIALVLAYFGTLDYAAVFSKAPAMAQATIEAIPGAPWLLLSAICIGLFVGAMGKSAQFPLHVWLPDSMEGPTPISALIHAATMVTAGIFMVARMSPLFEHSQTALTMVLVVGGITAFFMALIAVVQYDIKRVVAYSTLSQLGYMTVALGASAYSAGIFHLMTHAFFKALLFLGAGSVIIALHHEQDMRKMGGLRKYMPVTYLTVLIGAIASVGVPGFAGFFSKDAIIEAVHLSKTPGAGFAWLAGHPVRVRHRVLHVPAGVLRLSRRTALREPWARRGGPRRPCPRAARVSACRDRAAGAARDSFGLRRLADRAGAVRGLFRKLNLHRALPFRLERNGRGVPRGRADDAARAEDPPVLADRGRHRHSLVPLHSET